MPSAGPAKCRDNPPKKNSPKTPAQKNSNPQELTPHCLPSYRMATPSNPNTATDGKQPEIYVSSRSSDRNGTSAPIADTTHKTPHLAPVRPTPLAGREVLIDTYNIRLKHGSGIKTYGMTLIAALRALGADVSLLGDRRIGVKSNEPALAEVMFYNPQDKPISKWWGRWQNAKRGLQSLTGRIKPTEIDHRHVLPDKAMRKVPGLDRVYNAQGIYDSANAMFRRLKKVTRLSPPRNVDVWHATTLLPIVVDGAKMVTTIHDLIPLRLPYTTLDDKKFFFRLTQEAIKRSDLITTVSECTKRDIQLFFDVPDDKIAVTYQSIDFKPYQPDESLEHVVLERYNLQPGKYLLFVGNIEPKKNVIASIKAAAMLATDMPLVVVGRKAWMWEEQLESVNSLFGPKKRRINQRFRALDFVAKADLPALYANAFCFLFPSLYEGFGLPPLEAMAHGCPVISSNVSSLPEVCGNAAMYVDPHEPESIRQSIERLLNDEDKRKQMIAAGYERLAFFSPQNYAERLAVAYEQVLAG